MPNQLAITLHASAARTTDGTGTPVDVAARTYTEVTLDVTAITGTLVVTIESSHSQSAWLALGHFHSVTAPGVKTLIVPDGHKWLRAKWTVTDSATFVVTGTAHQLYALPRDISDAGESIAKAVSIIPLVTQAKACLAASSEAEGYLAAANTLPISSLDAATRQHIARMAVFEMFRYRPGSTVGASEVANEIGRSEAIKWLKGIATGGVRPPGLVDATPDTVEAGAASGSLFVLSRPGRGW